MVWYGCTHTKLQIWWFLFLFFFNQKSLCWESEKKKRYGLCGPIIWNKCGYPEKKKKVDIEIEMQRENRNRKKKRIHERLHSTTTLEDADENRKQKQKQKETTIMNEMHRCNGDSSNAIVFWHLSVRVHACERDHRIWYEVKYALFPKSLTQTRIKAMQSKKNCP